jgi:hypothetical protein
MKRLFGILPAVFALLLTSLFLIYPQQAGAADVRSGRNLILTSTQKQLQNLYLFGSTVQLNAPVKDDVLAAGGMVNLTGNVTNDVLAAGGTVIIHGKVGNNARVAGGNITVDGPVTHDLVVAGGNVTISKNAAIGGDLLVFGGNINVQAPVHGKILMSGGSIVLNNTVGGNVSGGRVGSLTLGPQAKIKGNLSYNSPQQAQHDSGSTVMGTITYHHIQKNQRQQHTAQAVIGAALYRLGVAIILSILFIYFFKNGILTILTRMQKAPWKSLGIGFVSILLAPIASAILLILIWLGIASFLSYGLILIISIFFTNVFVGWWLMNWWNNRQKKSYQLDWKAGVIGPIVLFIILLIPVLGWLFAAIIFLIATGAFLGEIVALVPQLQGAAGKK